MRRVAILLIALISFGLAMRGAEFDNVNLRYNCEYHLGFVRITAGEAYVKVGLEGNLLTGTFNGRSIPWHGRVYSVNDTLRAKIEPARGLSHATVLYENGFYTKPKVRQLESGKFDASNPDNYKDIYGRGKLDASAGTIEAVTITADMLSLYYYFSEIDFDRLQPGEKVTIGITLPDGDVQHVEITYNGTDTYNGHNVYATVFEYSYHGEMDNYPVKCLIDSHSRIPLLLSANLKIGHVELVLNP